MTAAVFKSVGRYQGYSGCCSALVAGAELRRICDGTLLLASP